MYDADSSGYITKKEESVVQFEQKGFKSFLYGAIRKGLPEKKGFSDFSPPYFWFEQQNFIENNNRFPYFCGFS